jgi:hypothetical protein
VKNLWKRKKLACPGSRPHMIVNLRAWRRDWAPGALKET